MILSHQVCWDDLKLAHKVCLSRSLTKTSEIMGISSATIIRRLDRLEEVLGVTLFIRHPRGYHPTDAGKTLVQEFPELLEHIENVKSKICQQQDSVAGVLNVTILPELSSLFCEAMQKFRSNHPNVRLSIFVSENPSPMHQGDYHIAIGTQDNIPHSPDLIVKELYQLNFGYFASKEYVSHFGLPKNEKEFHKHDWVLPTGKKLKTKATQTISQNIDSSSIAYQSNNFIDIESAVRCGMGIGPVTTNRARTHKPLVAVNCCGIDTVSSVYFIFHKDFKGDNKITSFYEHLKKFITENHKYFNIELS